MQPLWAAYGLIAAFIVVERRLRKGPAASTFEALPSDRGTRRMIGAAYAFSLNAGLVAPLLSRFGIGRLPDGAIQCTGLGLMLAGLGCGSGPR